MKNLFLSKIKSEDKNYPLKITQIISHNNQIFYSYQNGNHYTTPHKYNKKRGNLPLDPVLYNHLHYYTIISKSRANY